VSIKPNAHPGRPRSDTSVENGPALLALFGQFSSSLIHASFPTKPNVPSSRYKYHRQRMSIKCQLKIGLSPRRYLYFDVVVVLAWSKDPDSFSGGRVANGGASHAIQVKNTDPDKRYTLLLQVGVWGWG
jgi:hypothetical protein